MNSSPTRVEILWPKQVIWLPRPQIKLVWFNFRFGAIQQPYITADIFHYPAKAGGGRGQGCRSPQEDIIVLLWHTFSHSHSLPPSYNRAIYNTQTHRAVTAHARERIRYIQIIVIVPVRSVRDDVNSIIATVSERECVRVSVRQTAVCCCTQTAGWRKTALLAVYASENCCLFLWWPAVTLIALTWRISALFIVWSGQNEMLFMCLHFCLVVYCFIIHVLFFSIVYIRLYLFAF